MRLCALFGLAFMLAVVAAPAGWSGFGGIDARAANAATKSEEAQPWVKVQVYQQGVTEDPDVTVSVPLSAVKVAARLMPEDVRQRLLAEGVDVPQLVEAAEAEGVRGVLAVVEKDARRIVISLE